MLIEFKNISKTYTNTKVEVPVLKDITIGIEENEFVSLMGPSGSGKTTMLYILGLLDSASSGNYLFNNKDVTRLNHYELAEIRNKNIGFIFQSFNLFPKYNAQKNVELPLIYQNIKKTERQKMARIALEKVGLSQRATHLPMELSGGEQQRVAIARAIVHKPRLILADEPTGNLDSKTGSDILQIFTDLHADGNTIFLITHDAKVAHKATHHLSMYDGKIIKK